MNKIKMLLIGVTALTSVETFAAAETAIDPNVMRVARRIVASSQSLSGLDESDIKNALAGGKFVTRWDIREALSRAFESDIITAPVPSTEAAEAAEVARDNAAKANEKYEAARTAAIRADGDYSAALSGTDKEELTRLAEAAAGANQAEKTAAKIASLSDNYAAAISVVAIATAEENRLSEETSKIFESNEEFYKAIEREFYAEEAKKQAIASANATEIKLIEAECEGAIQDSNAPAPAAAAAASAAPAQPTYSDEARSAVTIIANAFGVTNTKDVFDLAQELFNAGLRGSNLTNALEKAFK